MATDTEARQLWDRVSQQSAKLRSDCGSFDFLGSDDACANSADEIDAYLAGAGPMLLQRSEGGDTHAHDNLVAWMHKMLDFLRTAYGDISSGDTVGDFAQALKDTAVDDAGDVAAVGSGFAPWIIGGVVLLLGGFLLVRR